MAAPRGTYNPHDTPTVGSSKPSSRGAPAWADDPDEVARELAAMDQRDAGKRQSAHVAAHKENIRRNRAAKAKAARESTRASKAADAQAAAAAKAAADEAERTSVGGRAKTFKSQADTIGDVTSGGGLRIDDASGFVLALLAWSWVVLPFLDGGASGVRDMLRAKFFNQDAKGNPLP